MKVHYDTRSPICPWCDTLYPMDIPQAGEKCCGQCSKMFEVEYYATPSFNTHPMIPCPDCKRLVALDTFPVTGKVRISLHADYSKSERCPASRTMPVLPD